MQPIGQRLKNLRLRTGQSLKRAAALVRVSYSHLSRVENGIKQPSPQLVARLSQLYGADVDDLLAAMGELPEDVTKILQRQGKEAINLLRQEYANPESSDNDD